MLTLQSRHGINLTFIYSIRWRNQHFLYIEKSMPLTKQIPIGLNHLHQQSFMWPPMHPKSSSAAPARALPSHPRAALAGFFCFYQHTNSGTAHSALSWFWGGSAARYIFAGCALQVGCHSPPFSTYLLQMSCCFSCVSACGAK